MTMMPDSLQEKFNKLYELCKNKGSIASDEVMAHLVELDIEPDQVTQAFEMLDAMGIVVQSDQDSPAP